MSVRPDYCPIGNEPCQAMCHEPCSIAKKASAMSTTDKVKLPGPDFTLDGGETPCYYQSTLLAMHEQGRLAGLEEAARAVADTPREEWVDGSDQWGNPCPARVYTTRAQYVAAIRSLAAASIGAKLGEE